MCSTADGVTNINTNTTVTTPAMNNPNMSTPTTMTPMLGGDSAGMNPLIPENSTAPSKTTTTTFLVFLIILSLMIS